MNQLSRSLSRLTSRSLRCFASTSANTSDHSSHRQQSMGPSVRLLLNLYGIEVSKVEATGPHGRLLKGDVLNYINSKGLEPKPFAESSSKPESEPTKKTSATPHESQGSKPSSTQQKRKGPSASSGQVDGEEEDYIDLELTSMRKTIAKRLTMSKSTIPHMYTTAECDVSSLIKLRKDLIRDGQKVSLNDFIVKACAVALQRMPQVNCSWKDDDIELNSTIDISVAVATDNGLITPIVTEANVKGVSEISSTIKELAGRARQNKLKPSEFQGGSFTISNLGMYGIREFTAVINPPQSAILAVGTTKQALNEAGKPISTITITLSSDSRAIDEETAGRFVSVIKEGLEQPDRQLL